MSFKIHVAALVGALVSATSAHGHVSGIVADGTFYPGYDPSFQYQATPPKVVGWSCPGCLDNGFVSPDMYTTSNIACHKNATAGQASAKVAAGGTVELQWTPWPTSHHGPVLDYLAKCDGDCTTTTAEGLSFFKIDHSGLLDDTTSPGNWASDKLISNNNSWTVTIPSDITPGNYVLRHEIIALHSAGQVNGAQNYPQCINIQVTGGGSASPAGVAATKFYTSQDPGILVNIYQTLTYDIPGPVLSSGAGSSPKSSAVASEAPASGTAAASSSSISIVSSP
ncbi:putative endoglucanase, partial [Clohesyomyces aquaticus]